MIKLKLKAEFNTSSDPFLLKLFEEGKPVPDNIDRNEVGLFKKEINFLNIHSAHGT